MAVHADEQRHRDKCRFPKEVEQEEIKRRENPDQRRFEQQQEDEEFLYTLVNGGPRDENAQGCKESRQHHQPHRDAVDSHVVVNVGSRDPLLVDFELEASRVAVQMDRKMQRRDERQYRDYEGEEFNVAVAPGDHKQQQASSERNKRHQRQNVGIEARSIHRTPLQTM